MLRLIHPIQAFLHECGHALNNPHHSSGIMARGYHEWNRSFMTTEAKSKRTRTDSCRLIVPAMDDKENHWHRMSLMRLRYHPTMRLPRDPQIPYTYDAIAPSFSVIDDGVVVTGAVGLGSIEVQVDGSYRKHVEFPFCGRQSQPPPQTLRLTTAEITKLIDRDPGSCKVTIEAIGTDQRQAEIQDFGALCRGSRLIVHITSNDPAAPIPTASVTTSSKLKQSLGRLTHRDSPSGNASCPIPIVSHGEAKGPDQLQVIKGIPVGQEKPQNPAFMVVLNSCQPTSPKLVKVDVRLFGNEQPSLRLLKTHHADTCRLCARRFQTVLVGW